MPLAPISIAAREQVGTPYYGLVWLALSSLAYVDESAAAIGNVGVGLSKAVEALPDPPAPQGLEQPPPGTWGRWRIEWGPATDRDNANLMYVASYREIATGQPIVAAICIRGTDTQERDEPRGLLREIYEDMDAFHTVAWFSVIGAPPPTDSTSAAGASAAIAKGTFDGLQTLLALAGSATGSPSTNDGSILAFVREFATTYPDAPVVITGHSLGGCLCTVLALYLNDTLAPTGLRPRLVPHTFAGPTAGTQGFAARFDATFPAAHIWWNTLDVVPNGFQDVAGAPATTPSLGHIGGFWHDYGGPAIDSLEKLVLDGFIGLTHGYSQPTTNVQTLIGQVIAPGATAGCEDTWPTQLLIQHCPPTYHRLMSTQRADTVAPYPLPPYSGGCLDGPGS